MKRTASIARSTGMMVVAVFTAFFIRYGLDPVLENNAPFVLFYGAILFSAWYGGWPYGVWATLLAAALSAYFIEPRYVFHIHSEAEIVSLALHIFTSLFGILLIEQLRRTKQEAREETQIRRTAEQALRESERRLLEAQAGLRSHADDLETRVKERTEALTRSLRFMEEFLYSMAHDLRAPVRAVKGLTEALIQDYAVSFDETGKDYGKRIDIACERMDRLIMELLEYGRLFHAPLELKPVRLAGVIQAVAAEFDEEIAQRLATLKTENVHQTVLANEAALKQILRNLISNSLKFVPPERKPAIRISSEERDDDRVLVCVEDNGFGIPEKYIPRIFKPFQRLHTHDEFPGVGMGLAIAHLAAERINANLTVRSSCDVGSCFCFDMKIAREMEASQRANAISPEPTMVQLERSLA